MTRPVRLLTWNVQAAAAARAVRQAIWLEQHAACDVAVLTEVPNAGNAHVDALEAVGFRCFQPSAAGDRRVLVAVRGGEVTAVEGSPPGWEHRLAIVDASVGTHALRLAGMYVPSRGPQTRRNVDKRAMQQAVAAVLPAMRADGVDYILGDLNVVEPGHQPPHSVFGQWEYDFYRSFETNDYSDAFRAAQPTAVEHSWFGKSGQGYRFDHAFVREQLRAQISSCWYDHSARAQRLSDHAALVLELGIG